jgi:hypothetical protein
MTNQANESNTEIQTTKDLDTLTFGVEIETYKLGEQGCAEAIRKVVGGTVTTVINPTNGSYDTAVVDREGRNWICTQDGSIDGPWGCEIVTPVLRHSYDMSILQEVARSLRAAGARVNDSCGIHVHVGLTSMGATEKEQVKTLKNLCNLVYKHETHINKSMGVSSEREMQWAARLPESFVKGIKKARTMNDVMAHYYDKCGRGAYARDMNFYRTVLENRDAGRRWGAAGHYCSARYSGLNLHNLCFKSNNARTVEFRLFDATLHAGKIRAYVTLCLALVARAKNASRTSSTRKACDNDNMLREQTRWFFKALGLVGDRYDTVREVACDTHFDVASARAATRQYRAREDRARRAA